MLKWRSISAAIKIVILFAVTDIAYCGELLHIPYAFNNDDAKQQCLNAGYNHLAVIDSRDKFDQMITYFKATYGSYSNVYDFWIGCFFVNVGFGNYQAYWITDEYSFPVNWTRWALFEPDFMGSQTCTRINSDFNFRTQDCSDSFGILCEKHDTCEGLANGSSFTVTFSNGQKLGSIAYYTCRPGYHSTGEYTRTCTMIGEVAEWSGMELNCTLESCPILQNGSTFSISLSNDHAIGSVATYICLPGYSSSTESLTRTCLHNGMNVIWSGNEPSCMPSTVPSSATTTESLSPTTTLTEVLSTTPDTETITPTIASTHDSSATTSDVNDPIITSSVPGASGARPIFLMPCYCYPDKAFAGMTEQTIIALLVRDTAIRTNETTVAIFRRKCREDKRFSSKVIGMISASVIVVFFLLIMLSDCNKLRRDGLRIRR